MSQSISGFLPVSFPAVNEPLGLRPIEMFAYPALSSNLRPKLTVPQEIIMRRERVNLGMCFKPCQGFTLVIQDDLLFGFRNAFPINRRQPPILFFGFDLSRALLFGLALA